MTSADRSVDTGASKERQSVGHLEECKGVNVAGNMKVTGDVKVYMTHETQENVRQPPKPYTQIQADIRGMLQRRYRNMQMPKMPWMHDWYHPLKNYYVDLALHSKGHGQQAAKSIQLEDLFQLVGNIAPKRILIEGPAGYGKTTLALKLCDDWANEQKAYTANFEIVLLVQLRNLTSSLADIVQTRCKVSNVDSKDVLSTVENCQKKVLLILDGYDEVPKESKVFLLPLLRSELYAEMTVIVTSRNGLFDLDDAPSPMNGNVRNQPQSAEFAETFTYLCDKRITIRGITDASQSKFLEKYFENMPNHEQVTQAKEALKTNFGLTFGKSQPKASKMKSKADTLRAAELLECPLFLLLIVILVSETKIEVLKTKTELYKILFNFVVRRGLSRIGIMDEVDMFNFDKFQQPSYVTAFSEFAEFALNALIDNRVSFTIDDIKKYCEGDLILKLGFMTRNESVDGLRNTVMYEPVHKSVLEFAASYHLWYSFYTCCFADEISVKLTKTRPFLLEKTVKNTSLVCTFTAGLMGKHVTKLLQALTPMQSTTNCDTSWFNANSALLEECTVSDELLSFLSSFLTPVWLIDHRIISQDFFQSPLHKALMEYGLKKRLIRNIFWNLECQLVNFPSDIQVDKIVLQMDTPLIGGNERSVTMTCEELYCCISSGEKQYWHSMKVVIGRITFQKASFHLTKEAASFLFHLKYEISFGIFRQIPIRWIRCELCYKKSHFLKILTWLIKKEKLNGIYLTFLKAYDSDSASLQSFRSWWCLKCLLGKCDSISEKEKQSFVKCCKKSVRLQDFVLTNFDAPLSFDLHQLCSRGQRPLRIDLQQNIIISTAEQFDTLQTVCVEHFRATDFLECDFDIMIRACQMHSLECSNVFYKSSTLQLLEMLEYDRWPICRTLSHLYIVMDRDIFENGYFTRIDKLQNLTVLALEMDTVTIFSKECGMEQMLHIVRKCSRLERIEFWNIQYLCDQPADFFSDIAALLAKDGVCTSLKTIMLQGDINETTWGEEFCELLTLLKPLQEIMITNHLLELWLVNEEQHYFKSSKHDWETAQLLEKCLQSSIFGPAEEFEITKDLLGMKEEDSTWSKRGWENPFENHTNYRFYKHKFYSQNRFSISKERYVTYC